MTGSVPQNPKLYHIIHIDRLESIIKDGFLYSDAHMHEKSDKGTMIGINNIKERRLTRPLSSCHNITVGNCVPFYFCPRSIMLYVIYCGNSSDLLYKDGQDNIIHLEFDMNSVKNWAESKNKECFFTTSNAGSFYFDDYNDFTQLYKINWSAVESLNWKDNMDGKQAEFLSEDNVSWDLVERIGVYNLSTFEKARTILNKFDINKTKLETKPDWYY